MLCAVFLFAALQLPGRLHSVIWVIQTPEKMYDLAGQNATMRCEIRSDTEEQISRCAGRWYVKTGRRWQEVALVPSLTGRSVKASDTNTSAVLTLTELRRGDSDWFYCTLTCNVNGRRMQHHGNGTELQVCGPEDPCLRAAMPTAGTSSAPGPPEEDLREELPPLPLYFLLSAKLLTLVVTAGVTALQSFLT